MTSASDTQTFTATEVRLDLRDLKCPLPVLRTRKALAKLRAGDVLRVECSDPLSVIDIPHFLASEGHTLIDMAQGGRSHVFTIRKTERPSASKCDAAISTPHVARKER